MPDQERPCYIVSVGPPNGPFTRIDDVKFSDFAFVDEETKADKLTLTIDNYDLSQFDSAHWVHGNVIQFQFGYPEKLSELRSCAINKLKHGRTSLVIEAQAKESQLNRLPKQRCFENAKRSDVARQIASEAGIRDEDMEIDDTEVVLEQITQASMTDMQLLRDMAEKDGFIVYFEHDQFHFKRRRIQEAPIRTFTYFIEQNDAEWLDWSIEDDKKAGKAGAVTVQGIDPVTKEPIEVRSDKTAEGDRPALGDVVDLIDAKTATSHDVPVDVSKAAAHNNAIEAVIPTTEKTAAAAGRTATGTYLDQQLKSMHLTGHFIGDPWLKAKSVILLQGIGRVLSGRWYAQSVKHDLKKESYTMEIKFKRDAKSGGSGIPAGGVENTKASKDTGDGSPPAPEEVEVIDPRTATSGTSSSDPSRFSVSKFR